MDDTFRCSAASLADAEPLAGTAPTESAYLLLEHPGAWGRQALAESDLPADVRTHLASEPRVRVQLIRRPGRSGPGPRRVYAAWLGAPAPALWATTLDDPADLLALDLPGLAEGRGPAWQPHDGHLWLVCTNGRRDRCCAELGRPVAAALAEHWPDGTWETTHLGGHRFAGTLLALPSGVTLGRVDADTAVAAAREVEAGGLPVEHLRGRAGCPPAAQVAEVALRAAGHAQAHWVLGADETRDDGSVATTFRTPDGDRTLVVVPTPGPPRRQSCADLKEKPTRSWTVVP